VTSSDTAGDLEPPVTPDYLSRTGAGRLALEIREFWSARG
jgi:hypothetical protein